MDTIKGSTWDEPRDRKDESRMNKGATRKTGVNWVREVKCCNDCAE
jgi:hypothetical protein